MVGMRVRVSGGSGETVAMAIAVEDWEGAGRPYYLRGR